jgi:hypothetical protein
MQRFSLRHRGQPFAFEGKAGMYGDGSAGYGVFNSAITFPAREPAIVVNVGDPINSGFFYLVREKDGRPVAEYLGPSNGGVSAEFLDVPPRGRVRARNVTTKRARFAEGRWLLLGDYTVLDTRSLQAHRLRPAKAAAIDQLARPLGFSRDQRSVVRIGTATDSSDAPCLVVFDFVADDAQVLTIDTRATRFTGWEEVDRSWVEHYFEWRPDDQGRDRLVPRVGVTPLPYHGVLTTDSSGYREYRISRASPDIARVLGEFLVREFAATRFGDPAADPNRLQYRVGEAVVHVSADEHHVSVWMDRDKGKTRMVADIAARFDAELATGRHDAAFALPVEDEQP